ncbi:MAG: succinic semialdehyde dehydrogenase, partial [Propionibacterium acidifaciens]
GSTAAESRGPHPAHRGRRHGVEGIVKYTQSQTVAVQHLAPLHAPPGADGERWASGMAAWLRLARHLPRLDR